RIRNPEIDFLAEKLERLRTKGDYGERSERKRKSEERRKVVDKTVDARGGRIFFKQELKAVGGGLQKAVRADAVRSPARLDMRDDFAFEPCEVGVHCQDDEEKQSDLDDRDNPKRVLLKEADHDFALASGTDSMACRYRPRVPLVNRESCAGFIKPTGMSYGA